MANRAGQEGSSPGPRHEEFVRRLVSIQDALRGYVVVHLPDLGRLEDILQEVAVALWRRFDDYRENQSFLGWAIGMARNEVLSARRQTARSRLVYEDEFAEKFAERYQSLEPELDARREALRKCLKRLPPHAKELVDLRYAEGVSLRTLSEKCGKTPGAVQVFLSRVRMTLGDCIERTLRAAHGAV